MATAAAAYVSGAKRKRHLEDLLPDFDDSFNRDYEDDQNLEKRSRLALLSEFLWLDDIDDLDTVQDELVLNEMKKLEEEINMISQRSTVSGSIQMERNATSKKENNTGEVKETISSTGSYEYIVSVTDDELGIPQSPPVPVDENDWGNFSQKFWSDLVEDSSTSVIAGNGGMSEKCLSHCYSSNYSGVVSDPDRQ